MKRVSVLVLLILTSFILISCRDSKIQVGILQFVSHTDLDDAREGIIEELEKEGFKDNDNIKITLLNPQTDAVTMQSQAKQLVRKSDILIGIATPAAVALVNEVKDQGKETPVIFTAVTDPVEAKIVESMENPGGFVTGTSDMNPIEIQMSLVKRIKPDAKSVGILYTSSEPNSKVQADLAKEELESLGLEVNFKTLTDANDITQMMRSLISENDVIYIPSDNLISSSMGAIKTSLLDNADKGVPIIATTTFQVEEGASLTYGFSYLDLGKQTGTIAARVLNGENPKDISVEIIEDVELIINLKQLKEDLNIDVSQDLIDEANFIIE